MSSNILFFEEKHKKVLVVTQVTLNVNNVEKSVFTYLSLRNDSNI